MTARLPNLDAEPRYGPVDRAVHWLVAALAVIVVSLGWAIIAAPRNTPQRELLLLLHRSVGLVIFAAMLFRTAWRSHHPAPPLPFGVGRLQRALARGTHTVLYLLFIGMPIAGYVNAATAGHPVSIFGALTVPALLPRNYRLSQIAIAFHLAGQYLIYFFVGLHVAGALLHGIIRRDGVLQRMLPLRRSA